MASPQQPEFAWIPEFKGLLVGKTKKEQFAQGRSVRAFVYPWGYGWISGDNEGTARWGDVAAVFRSVVRHSTNGRHTYTSYRFGMRLADGREHSFAGTLRAGLARESEAARLTPVPGVTTPVTIEQLGRLLVSGATSVQLPKAVERLRSGQGVQFGPLNVSPAGIMVKDQLARWEEIQSVRTLSGTVYIKKAGKRLTWKSVPVPKIANYFVFDALVRSILEQRQAGRPATG